MHGSNRLPIIQLILNKNRAAGQARLGLLNHTVFGLNGFS